METINVQIEENAPIPVLEQVERQILADRIIYHGGNLTQMAMGMRCPYQRIWRKIKKYNMTDLLETTRKVTETYETRGV